MAEPELSPGEIRARAVQGVALIGLRGLAMRVLAFAGNIALARLLVPEDFGILAFGQAFVVFAGFVANAGVAAALLRGSEPPSEADLSAVLGFQLAVGCGLTLAMAVAAAPFGELVQVSAVIVAALPLGVLRTPTAILLERSLQYSRLSLVEVVEVVVYVAWSVGAVALGAGVWGVATAVVVRSGVGSALLLWRSPVRHLRPRLDWPRVRRLLGFGLQVQAAQLVNLVRSQGLNLAVAAIAGLPVLGLWGLVERVMLLPLTLFEGLWRVAFPAIARLTESGIGPARDIERAISVGTISAGAVLVGLAASAPASVPLVFGDQWTDAADAVPPCCLALLLSGPMGSAGAGYLYAAGNARRVLVSTLANTVTYAAVALPLLPLVGAEAMGWGWLAAAMVDVIVIGGSLHAVGVRLLATAGVPVLAATAAGGAGLAYALSEPPTVATALLSGAGALALYLAALRAVHAGPLRRALATGVQAAHGLRGDR